ncbi:ferritin-like domain-containing protein [Bacillus sp. Marseille-P3661]|uniref:ferritin-like domain-containing protein n=1 Tax=Bacillus sp. Marseille-P3661 TaxID=1936234 RepID=UPI000C857E36|nr:ferritin-like domain-containing protein [Bacillus sp. Marseille-P3661]
MYNYYYQYGYPIKSVQTNYGWNPSSQQRNQDFNIPYLPILGQQSVEQIAKHIYTSIVNEATAAEFYSRLLHEVPDELHREFIQHAYEDEVKHLQAFTKLYIHCTGQNPQYNVQHVEYSNYKAGILKALKDELEAAEFYRDVQLSSVDPLVKDTFFYAMVDELEHATQFGVLYNTL